MKLSTLHPPNSRLLSADVISGVVQQRSKVSRNAYVDQEHSLTLSHLPQPPRIHTSYVESENPNDSSTDGRWASHHGTTEMTTKLRCAQNFTPYSASRDGLTISEGPAKPITHKGQMTSMVEMIIADKVRLRELRRVRQIRYRQKKENYAASLDDGNKKLRSEIEQLSQRRRVAVATIASTTSGWSVAVEYFRLFQYGVRNFSDAQRSVQMAFLQETMAPDILFNSGYGIEAILDYWHCISQWFANFEVELKALEKASSNTLVASTVTTITISEITLRQIFPHLLSMDQSKGLTPLAQELLDQTLIMQGSAQFEWDREHSCVGSIRSHSDMIPPLLCVLGDLDKVSRVFSKALITPDFRCKAFATRS
ncbi:uncharacterized protein PHALS_11220 [Plasmopara halstedii]|uniref:BZIP transcription factor 1 n=1 Tax=Plasmopara halstedii TaxID=4781 RepID=A0A0N7L5C0_PLAHL|nr:uncharacterized protein PHALS_11220 [Plasmopara halstedii]CEG41051.1 hypothetical protein PHALS_11220 [Plasmopara halstedii]|eukprot:XP_024577420.1 hypothetical protein PHALS_11220 [Plasmopara halstedii]